MADSRTPPASRLLVLADADGTVQDSCEPGASRRRGLLEAGGAPGDGRDLHVSWSGATNDGDCVALPALAEQHAIRIRGEYLAWLSAVAGSNIGGQTLEARLCWQGSSLSFWHMSLIAEKSPMKSAGIHTIFKLRALEMFYSASNCRGLEYRGANRVLARILSEWMVALGHRFHHVPAGECDSAAPRRLPRFISAWAYLARKLWQEVRLARRGVAACVRGTDSALPLNVFTYFPNFDTAAAARGQFRSRYWEDLHELFAESGRPVNWIWIYSGTGDTSYAQALSYAGRFNAGGTDRHLLLEQFASWTTVTRTLRRYFLLLRAALTIRPPQEAFRLRESKIEFFALLEAEWQESLLGSTAMANAWNASLYESAAAHLPRAAATFYPWENHPWEYALLSALRSGHSGHTGTIIGHQHGLPAPLNLRYIPLPQTLVPDWLVVGGKWARQITLTGGAAPERIVMCEAVRYQYLSRLPGRAVGGKDLLIITSLLENETVRQLTLAAQAFRNGGLRQFGQILVKPHPFRAVDALLASLGVEQDFKLTTQPLGDLWQLAAAAFVANSTGAGVDALYAGIPFVICSAGDMMNLNPLFTAIGTTPVSTPEDLESALKNASSPDSVRDHLWLDPALPRWRDFLTRQSVLAAACGEESVRKMSFS